MFGSSFLDSKKALSLDRHQVHASLQDLPAQISQAWTELSPLSLPASFHGANKILVCGMGGSALGARIISSIFASDLRLPVFIHHDYHLPAWIDKHTLIILSSYSGGTDEIISCAATIPEDVPTFVITTGGKLAEMADSHGWPAYIFTPQHNPSGQPRLAIGYSTFALFTILHLLDQLDSSASAIDSLVEFLQNHSRSLLISTPRKSNPAKTLAEKLHQSQLILVSSQHLDGSVYAGRNMLHENAKTLTHHYTLPELNHHLLEGLTYPRSSHSQIQFVFFDSDLYPEIIKKRLQLTIDVVGRQGYRFHIIKPEAPDKLAQSCETIQFLGFLSFYLALLHRIDPASIPWVDYLKSKL
ncbi:hypothetical protein A2368_00160 [Candidatus Collierbacteria bacterium RIFOXYB1_FULL_49_13]|uniref:SIS domain-containing protein n=1 Tax=Candidatus Collierbacteria bacterium RIFOXYB1_FULL_49_13 TaxID=1817728 RepID=A0A1F5FJ14_9BACT|nr:MAG: hypothetical protein A2368_00160 [Candidatus Collierbacteria bacterium RIFOXYB1_FULL_49_13]